MIMDLPAIRLQDCKEFRLLYYSPTRLSWTDGELKRALNIVDLVPKSLIIGMCYFSGKGSRQDEQGCSAWED